MPKKNKGLPPKPFLYQANHSKMVEFILMPNIARIHLDTFTEDPLDAHSKINDEAYKSLLAAIQNDLSPFKDDISKFYFNDAVNLISLLSARESLFEFDSVYGFIHHCLGLTESELKASILYCTLTNGDFTDFQEPLWSEANEAIHDPTQAMRILNDNEYTSDTKWQVLTLLQDPKKALTTYEALLKELEPIFDKHYKAFEGQLTADVEAFFNRIEALGDKPLDTLSHGILNDALLPKEGVHFLFSYFNAYSVILMPSLRHPMILWGAKVETTFNRLKELHAEQQLERVNLFKTLGDKTRYDVLKCVASGITSTKLIAEALGVTPATISYHLNTLTTTKLILLTQQDNKLLQKVNQEWIMHHIEAFKADMGIK